MIIVGKALEKRVQESDPFRVAIIGAGFMLRGAALENLNLKTVPLRIEAERKH